MRDFPSLQATVSGVRNPRPAGWGVGGEPTRVAGGRAEALGGGRRRGARREGHQNGVGNGGQQEKLSETKKKQTKKPPRVERRRAEEERTLPEIRVAESTHPTPLSNHRGPQAGGAQAAAPTRLGLPPRERTSAQPGLAGG